jgi:probable rRNA maturation factor
MSDDPDEPSMSIELTVLSPAWRHALPEAETLARRAAVAALAAVPVDRRPPAGAELSLVLADDAVLRRLNRDYRGQDKPTNVLSFANQVAIRDPADLDSDILGDVVLARGTLCREAAEQGKDPADHLCHLVAHGVLHLLGYDHEIDSEAVEMEGLEAAILARLGIADPYAGLAAREVAECE